MSTSSRRYAREYHSNNPPGWLLLMGVFALIGWIIAAPALLIGTAAYYLTVNRLPPKWHFGLWFLISLPCAYFLYWLWQHGLDKLLVTELVGYIRSARDYQIDLQRWPWSTLWATTWPMWIQSLAAAPLWTFWLSLTNEATGNVARNLNRQAQDKQRRHERSQARAYKKARPGRTPDQAGGMMTIGVPIREEEP